MGEAKDAAAAGASGHAGQAAAVEDDPDLSREHGAGARTSGRPHSPPRDGGTTATRERVNRGGGGSTAHVTHTDVHHAILHRSKSSVMKRKALEQKHIQTRTHVVVKRLLCGSLIPAISMVSTLLITSLVFAIFEEDHEKAMLAAKAEDTAALVALQTKYNMSAADFSSYLRIAGHTLSSNTSTVRQSWAMGGVETVFFSFSVLTSIGYGNFTPATTGGMTWVIVLGLVGLPIFGVTMITLSTTLLTVWEEVLVSRQSEVAEAFHRFDLDSSGILDLEEFRGALDALEIDMSEKQFATHVREIDDGSHTIDIHEFALSLAILHLPIASKKRSKMSLCIALVAGILWLFVGSMIFSFLEGWSYFESLYFCTVTLTTIGLGDYTPSSITSHWFTLFYALVGLGIFSAFIGAIKKALTQHAKAAKKVVKEEVAESLAKHVPAVSSTYVATRTRPEPERTLAP